MSQQRSVDPQKVIDYLTGVIAKQTLQIAQLEAFIADNVPQETT